MQLINFKHSINSYKFRNPMKNIFLVLFILMIAGYTDVYGQCTDQKGFSDFPFTQGGVTVTSPSYVLNFATPLTNCGVTTEASSIYLGSTSTSTAFVTNFTAPLNNIVFFINAADVGETFTLTVDAGTPSISMIGGTCTSSWSITGNTLNTLVDNAATIIKVTSTQPYSQITITHNQAGGGALMTFCFADSVFPQAFAPRTSTAPEEFSFRANSLSVILLI